MAKSGLIDSRGGFRQGSGRKRIGETRRLSLTLPEYLWSCIDDAEERKGDGTADIIRKMLIERMALS